MSNIYMMGIIVTLEIRINDVLYSNSSLSEIADPGQDVNIHAERGTINSTR
jgi:hypothetical protein